MEKTLSREEYLQIKWMEQRIDEGGNDGADIEEYQDFCRALERQYDCDFKTLEANTVNLIASSECKTDAALRKDIV